MVLKFAKDINTKNKQGNTPLHYAVFGENLKNVEVLVNKGADVALNVRNEDNLTPLVAALVLGDEEEIVVQDYGNLIYH